MYMNVNAILAAQRPGRGSRLAALPARPPRRPPAAQGAAAAGLSRLLARASRPHARAQGSGSAWAALCGSERARPVHV